MPRSPRSRRRPASGSARSTAGSPARRTCWPPCAPTGCAGSSPSPSAPRSSPDPWDSFASFVEGVIEEDTHSLTVHLAGTFTPTPELSDLAQEASDLGDAIVERAVAAGAVRDDLVTEDVAMIFEQVTAVRVDDPARTRVLRARYLALLLDAVRPGARTGALPGPGPTGAELGARWIPR